MYHRQVLTRSLMRDSAASTTHQPRTNHASTTHQPRTTVNAKCRSGLRGTRYTLQTIRSCARWSQSSRENTVVVAACANCRWEWKKGSKPTNCACPMGLDTASGSQSMKILFHMLMGVVLYDHDMAGINGRLDCPDCDHQWSFTSSTNG